MAGTVTLSSTPVGNKISKFAIAWTSDAGGAVSGNRAKLQLRRGRILQIGFTPGSGGTQPTDLYDE